METLSRNFIALFFAFSSFGGLAHAQDKVPSSQLHPEKNAIGRLRVGIDKSMLGYQYSYYKSDAGVGFPRYRPHRTMGLWTGNWWSTPPEFHVGYRLNESLVLGTRLALFWDTDRGEGTSFINGEEFEYEDKSESFDFTILPYIEYLFGDGPIRPFVTAIVGYTGCRNEYGLLSDSSEMDSISEKSNGLVAGVGGGIHVFVGKYFSLDAEVIGAYSFNYNRNRINGSALIQEGSGVSTVHGFEVEGKLGISGWLGGG
ncbi:MAG: hypothetical protein GY847_31705 [Proteobacteria bacterium]|nr:hypothetical protein [Pseudomonadota bacterium]